MTPFTFLDPVAGCTLIGSLDVAGTKPVMSMLIFRKPTLPKQIIVTLLSIGGFMHDQPFMQMV